MKVNGSQPRCAVLYVDDEVKALQYFREAFEDEFTIYTANNAAEGYSILMEPASEIQAVRGRAMDLYEALVERDRLLGEKFDTVRHVIMADKVAGLGILAEGLNHHLR